MLTIGPWLSGSAWFLWVLLALGVGAATGGRRAWATHLHLAGPTDSRLRDAALGIWHLSPAFHFPIRTLSMSWALTVLLRKIPVVARTI
jgi:hypothetical protein